VADGETLAELRRRVGEAVTRDALRRRLRVVVAVAAVVGLSAWLGPKLRRTPAGPPDGDASLLVLVHRHRSGVEDRHQLLRVPFKGGESRPAETVWEGDSRPFYSLGWHRIIDGRYVVAGDGTVIDVWERRELHRTDPEGGRVESNSERVISGVHTDRARVRIVCFDLKTRTARKLTGPEAEPFALPGVRSPDGTKSFTWLNGDSDITLHRVGHAPRPLGAFWASESERRPNTGVPPALWLDNERFLTQHGNGNLITVALGGTRTPAVTVPVKQERVVSPHLQRDPGGRIVYTCAGEGFLIDVDAKTWERIEWAALGHGFDARWEPNGRGRYVIRYGGREIGDSRGKPHAEGHYNSSQSVTADGRLAIIDAASRQVRVWSAGSGEWTTLDTPADGLVGWLK
jgi:hypothetical protein